MQKTFLKHTVLIITMAIWLILFINFLFNLNILESQQYETFDVKINQIIHTLENNRMELELLQESLDEDYLTRAKAAAYVLDRQEDMPMNVVQMQYLAELLNVDELHVIDENGIIMSGSVLKYIGIDMSKDEQTRPFLDLIGRGDEDAYLIQEARPNAAEGKMMQYIGVARKQTDGIVQVGFTPTRQLEAQARNTYDYIFSRFPTDVGEEFFVIDLSDDSYGCVRGHSSGLDQDFSAECYQLDALTDCTKGAYKKGSNGETVYVVCRQYNEVLLCAALPRAFLYQKLFENTVITFIYLMFIEVIVIFLLNHLLKQKVINGINKILNSLNSITEGNLDTKVNVFDNREFEELSVGINIMIQSIINLSDRISAIIEISGIPLAAFEYERGIKHVFVTSGLRGLLGLSDEKATQLYKNAVLFDQYIHSIMEDPVKGEKEIYKINEEKYLQILLSEINNSCLGVITDVTKDMQNKIKLHYENIHDPLTGLYKFDYFKKISADMLTKIDEEKVAAVVMIDLDYFKSINDSYGHDAGDEYLKSFSNIMKSMPEEHFLPSRRSGDEFCMLIYDCEDKAEIVDYLNKFYAALQETPVLLAGRYTKIISASCGFALTDYEKDEIETLLSRADEALYEVKRGTKGTFSEYGCASQK